MKLRLTQPGWENFTSNFGGVDFVDGLSVDDVTSREGARLGNIVQCALEDGTNPSSSQAALESKCTPMVTRGDQVTRDVPTIARIYLKEELETLASEKGIKGLREVSEPLGVKATGIADLIELILGAQAPKAVVQIAQVLPLEPQPETVVTTTPVPEVAQVVAAVEPVAPVEVVAQAAE